MYHENYVHRWTDVHQTVCFGWNFEHVVERNNYMIFPHCLASRRDVRTRNGDLADNSAQLDHWRDI